MCMVVIHMKGKKKRLEVLSLLSFFFFFLNLI